MPEPLTKQQQAIYEFIADEIRTQKVAPSMKEIGTRMGLSSIATVHKHLMNLEVKGYIRRRFNHHRAIELLYEAEHCPTCGQLKPLTERVELRTRSCGETYAGWRSNPAKGSNPKVTN